MNWELFSQMNLRIRIDCSMEIGETARAIRARCDAIDDDLHARWTIERSRATCAAAGGRRGLVAKCSDYQAGFASALQSRAISLLLLPVNRN